MAFYKQAGAKEVTHVQLDVALYAEAKEKGVSVSHLVNSKFENADPAVGTAFQQICASEGLTLQGANPFGLRPATVADILDGKAGFQAGTANTKGRSTPFGTESRILFQSALLQLVEDFIQPDRKGDDVTFRSLVKTTVPIAGDTYEQPVVSYQNAGGANTGTNAAKAARVVQLGELPTILKLTTSDRFRKIHAYGIGIEMSDQAAKASTLDLFGMTVARYLQIEKDARVYSYLSDIFAGDPDQNAGAVPAVTTTALDPAATGGAVTHKAWVKFLARNRRKRVITHAICDMDTYLKIEGRTGRPGSNNYDPTLARIDPQLVAIQQMVGFGNNVQWMIVDPATEGGPVPANTVWALDKEQAIMLVSNTEADYKATEQFVLRRSEMMVWTWSEQAMRLFGDNDLSMFDVLTIA